MKRTICILVMTLMTACFAQAQPQPQAAPVRQQPEHLVPSGNLEGWYLKGIGERYEAANLYLYINGQAEFYIDYGFRSLLSSEFINEKQQGTSIVVDIYDMGDKDRAMGIYTAEKDPVAPRVEAGAEGYQSGQVLNFWKGPFYVKISVLGQIDGADRVLPLFARASAEKIAADNQFPERARNLGQEGLLPGSIKYTPKSFMGHSFITNTYSAEYTVGDGPAFRLFISEYKSPDEAKAAFDKYRDFVSKEKPKVSEELTGFGDAAFLHGDPLGKEYIIVRKGNFLCGAMGAKLGDAEKTLLKKIMP